MQKRHMKTTAHPCLLWQLPPLLKIAALPEAEWHNNEDIKSVLKPAHTRQEALQAESE